MAVDKKTAHALSHRHDGDHRHDHPSSRSGEGGRLRAALFRRSVRRDFDSLTPASALCAHQLACAAFPLASQPSYRMRSARAVRRRFTASFFLACRRELNFSKNYFESEALPVAFPPLLERPYGLRGFPRSAARAIIGETGGGQVNLRAPVFSNFRNSGGVARLVKRWNGSAAKRHALSPRVMARLARLAR